MHEVSLAQGIVQIVDDAALREGFSRVSLLRLEIGALSGVEPEALRFSLDQMALNNVYLSKAQIQYESPAAKAWCMACSQSIEINSRLDACPSCGGHQIQAVEGTELRVIDMIVHD